MICALRRAMERLTIDGYSPVFYAHILKYCFLHDGYSLAIKNNHKYIIL